MSKFITLRLFEILLLVYFLNSCSQNVSINPKIIIDDEHYNLRSERKDSIPTMNYEVNATKTFIVDATKYDFSVIRKLNGGKQPDLIQLFCKSGSYVIDLDTTKEIIVDENSARNVGGVGKFSGLIKGERAMIGIGSLMSNGNSVEFNTFWITMIDVK